MTLDPASSPTDISLSGRRLPTRTETIKAIGLMLLGFFFYSVSDLCSKLLSQSIDPLQIAWTRQLGLFAGVLILLAFRGRAVMRSSKPLLQLIRGVTVVTAATSFLLAISVLPLADATVITFVAPFMVTILAAIFLRERVGIKRWSAVAIGFLGTLIIIRPGLSAFQPAMLLALISTAAFALRQIISRSLAGADQLVTTVAYTAITATILLSLPLPFVWQTPADATELWLIIVIACVAGSGELSIIRALDIGQATVLSPLHYSLIVWSSLWGFLVFAQLPDIWTWTGTAIVIGSGIYSLYRETRASR